MNYRELSEAFDIYSNRYSESKDVALVPFDEYEKSLFLTKAAEEIVRELLPFYDRNEKIKKQLLSITRTMQIDPTSGISDTYRVKSGTLMFLLPNNVMYISYESIKNELGTVLRVVKPLKEDEIYHALENPFRATARGYAYRVSQSINTLGVINKYSEIITDVTIAMLPKYYIKYLIDIPAIVVAEDLDVASVKGVSSNSDLEVEAILSPLHEKILDRAIFIGYSAKSDDPNAKIALSNLSLNS